MLDIVEEKGIYRNYICDVIGKEFFKIFVGKKFLMKWVFFFILFMLYRNVNLMVWFYKFN